MPANPVADVWRGATRRVCRPHFCHGLLVSTVNVELNGVGQKVGCYLLEPPAFFCAAERRGSYDDVNGGGI